MSSRHLPTSFPQWLSCPLCNFLVKKSTHKHTELLASSYMCSQARVYEINYIDQQWKQSQDENSWNNVVASWQSAVGSRQSAVAPWTANILFHNFRNADRINYIYGGGEGWKGGCKSKMGCSLYIYMYIWYIKILLTDFHNLLLFWFTLFHTLKFVIHDFQFVNFTHFFQPLLFTLGRPLQNWNMQCKPFSLLTKCSIELLVLIWMHC